MSDQPSKIGTVEIQVQPADPDLLLGTIIVVVDGSGVDSSGNERSRSYVASPSKRSIDIPTPSRREGGGTMGDLILKTSTTVGVNNPLLGEPLEFTPAELPPIITSIKQSENPVIIDGPTFGKQGQINLDPVLIQDPSEDENQDDSSTSSDNDTFENESLEVVLNDVGLSSLRPEIVGIFDFIHPIISGGGDAPDILSPSGELFDMQTQLKQLRYSEALSWIGNMSTVTIHKADDGTKSLKGSAGTEWRARIGEAQAVVDYLGSIYGAINDFIDGLAKSTGLVDFNMGSMTAAQSLRLEDMLSKDGSYLYISPDEFDYKFWWLLWWEYPANVGSVSTITAFLKRVYRAQTSHDIIDKSTQSVNMAQLYTWIGAAYRRYPALLGTEAYNNDINTIGGYPAKVRFENSSGTTTDIAIGEIKTLGPIGPSFTAASTNTYDRLVVGDTTDSAASTISGVGGGTATGAATPTFFNLGGGPSGGYSDDMQNVAIPLTVFAGDPDYFVSESDDMLNQLSEGFTYPSNQTTAYLAYLSALDVIRAAKTEVSLDVNGSIGDRASVVNEYQNDAKELLGFSALFGGQKNVTEARGVPGEPDEDRADGSSLIGRLYITDVDTESTATIVGSFTDSLVNLPEPANGNKVRSGRSYYTDEITTTELDEAKRRLETLIDRVELNCQKLERMYKKSRVNRDSGADPAVSKTNPSPWVGGSQSGSSSAKQGPWTFHAWFVETMDDALYEMLRSGASGDYDMQMFHMAQAMSHSRPKIRKALLGLNMALYRWIYRSDATPSMSSTDSSWLTYQIWADTLWAEMLTELSYNIDGVSLTTGASVSAVGATYDYYQYWYGNEYESNENDDYFSSGRSQEWQINVTDRLFYDSGVTGAKNAAAYNPFRASPASDWRSEEPMIHTIPAHTVGRFEKSIREAVGGGRLHHGSHRAVCSTVKTMGRVLNGNTRVYLISSLTHQILGATRGTGSEKPGIRSTMQVKNTDASIRRELEYNFYYNVRNLCTIRNAIGVYQLKQSPGEIGAPGGGTEDLYSTHSGETWDRDGISRTNILCPGIWKGANTVLEILQEQTKEFEKPDKQFKQAVALAVLANKRVSDRASILLEQIDEISISDSEYGEALAEITSDPDFQETAVFGLTRDQMMLSRALLDSMGEENRIYPYLPASKATMTQDCMQIASFSKASELIRTDNTDKMFIMTVGVTAGMLEALRLRAYDMTDDTRYRYSNLMQIKIWRKDMMTSAISSPIVKTFDTSKFIFGGRKTQTAVASGWRDHADFDTSVYTGAETYENALASCIVRTYSPTLGNILTTNGTAYPHEWVETVDTSLGSVTINSENIFRNHANDFYLKQYIRQTQGYDVFEDTFPILEGNVFFEGPDPNKVADFDVFVSELSENYSIGSVTDALNFDRVRGEVERSVVFSGEKYRNRIIYPKMFERTFCLLVDTKVWDNSPIVEGDFHGELPDYDIEFESLGSDQVRVQHGFNQYFVTINILPYVSSAGGIDPDTGLPEDHAYVVDESVAVPVSMMKALAKL